MTAMAFFEDLIDEQAAMVCAAYRRGELPKTLVAGLAVMANLSEQEVIEMVQSVPT